MVIMSETEIVNNETTTETPVEQLPEVQAAMYIHQALPMFRTKLDALTGVQAKRVLEALIEAPLEKEAPAFTTKKAQDLYTLGLYITNAKFILFTTSLKDQNMVDKVMETSDNVNNESNNGEVSNGN
jgi:hypothetical protein